MTSISVGHSSRVSVLALRQLLHRHRTVLRDVYTLVLIQCALAGIGFVTRVQVANALGVHAFGELAFAVAFGTYCQTFIQYGLEKSFVRDLVQFPQRAGEFVQASLLVRLGLVIVLTIAFLVALPFAQTSSLYSAAILPALIATALGAFQLQGLYDAWKEMRRHAFFVTIERCVYCALVWIAIAIPIADLSLPLVGWCMLVAVVSGLLLQYRWAWRRLDFTPVQGISHSTLFIAQSSFWIWLAALSSLSIEYANQIILRYRAGNAELGGFSAAWILIQLSILMLNQVARVGAGAAARCACPDKSRHERAKFLLKYVLLMTVLGIIAGLPCLMFPRQMLSVFRTEYAAAAAPLRILSLYPMFYGPYLAVLQYVISSRLQKTYFAMISVVGLISMLLALWLVPSFGSTGAAISVVVAISIALFLFLIVSLASVTQSLTNDRSAA